MILDKTTRLLRLMDLKKHLDYVGYDDLNLNYLDKLQKEVQLEINKIR